VVVQTAKLDMRRYNGVAPRGKAASRMFLRAANGSTILALVVR
jgi:hypothetical protein